LYFIFKWREKRKIKKAIHSVFNKEGYSDIKPITTNVFRGITLHYYEKLFNAFSSSETLKTFLETHIENEGMSSIKRGLSKGKGVLLITAHFGGVEFIPGYLAANNYPVTILVRFSSKHLRNVSIQKAEKFSVKIIDVENTPNIMKEIFNDLKENRIVITTSDEIDEWRPSRHKKDSFLGQHVNCDRTLNILMKRTSASFVFGLMLRDPDCRYKFVATSWEEISKRNPSLDTDSIGGVALKFLEDYIYKNPEEWYQWKKYANMKTIPSQSIEVEGATSPSMLKPFLGKAP
jgi:lauroyl/myristoyl acyltransferase